MKYGNFINNDSRKVKRKEKVLQNGFSVRVKFCGM